MSQPAAPASERPGDEPNSSSASSREGYEPPIFDTATADILWNPNSPFFRFNETEGSFDQVEKWIKLELLPEREDGSVSVRPEVILDLEVVLRLLPHFEVISRFLEADHPLKALGSLSSPCLEVVRDFYTSYMLREWQFDVDTRSREDLKAIYIKLAELNELDMPHRPAVEKCLMFIFRAKLDLTYCSRYVAIIVNNACSALRERWEKGLAGRERRNNGLLCGLLKVALAGFCYAKEISVGEARNFVAKVSG